MTTTDERIDATLRGCRAVIIILDGINREMKTIADQTHNKRAIDLMYQIQAMTNMLDKISDGKKDGAA